MPKYASASIERAISTLCNINFSGRARIKHINAQIFTEKILSAHQALLPSIQIESFCVMREPLEWIESWYKYRSREILKKETNPNYTRHISYNDFITEYISKGTRKPFAKIRTQYDFLKLRNGAIVVDQIFPMENMGLIQKFLFKKTNKKNNHTSNKPISNQINDDAGSQTRRLTTSAFSQRHRSVQFNKEA